MGGTHGLGHWPALADLWQGAVFPGNDSNVDFRGNLTRTNVCRPLSKQKRDKKLP